MNTRKFIAGAGDGTKNNEATKEQTTGTRDENEEKTMDKNEEKLENDSGQEEREERSGYSER